MAHRTVTFADLLLTCAVEMTGLVSSLGTTLVAALGALCVAVPALACLSSPWAAIDRSVLPMVQVSFGGLLVADIAKPDELSTL